MIGRVNSDIFAFVKPSLDVHTLGLNSAAELLRDCGYKVIVADDNISKAVNNIKYEINQEKVLNWIRVNKITRIGISYRLDKYEAVSIMGYFMNLLKCSNLVSYRNGPIKSVYFAGLPETCEIIKKQYKGFVKTFKGGESAREFLEKMGVSKNVIPRDIIKGSQYDDTRMEFGKDIINAQNYETFKPVDRSNYKDYGTFNDTILKRIDCNYQNVFSPLIRAHVGPYSSSVDRLESVKEFISWVKNLSRAGLLDILSIGTSQLTQSNFGEEWGDKPNGGGVPINSAEEYKMIWLAARPMLLRTYAGTKKIPDLAIMHEKSLNICWHALSLWWFNRLDKRGPYDLLTSLTQHIEAIKYIAKTNKPYEANVSHHFAFRGADDITYIVSAYLAAKLAKRLGVKTFILQNMLNTPKSTWGIQDLAKSRAMLHLVKSLEDSGFRVLLQPRAGLDYFKSDLEEAKIQLAAVTALMDDIDPNNKYSPPIIHVVSYSEASHLATPEIINESIKITQHSLKKYRDLRKKDNVEDMSNNNDVQQRMLELLEYAKVIISGIEKSIYNPYSAEGLYKIFATGFLQVPYLWGDVDAFKFANVWKTKSVKGSVKTVDEDGRIISPHELVDFAKKNLKEVEYLMQNNSF